MERIRWLLDRSARVILGGGAGVWVGMVVFWSAKIVFPLLGLKIRDPHFRQGGAPEDVVNFAAISIFFATFSAGGTSALLTPWEWDWKTTTKSLTVPAVWSAVFGAIAGAWIGVGVGWVMLNLAAFGYLEAGQTLSVVCAIVAGVNSGVAAALALRRWRMPP